MIVLKSGKDDKTTMKKTIWFDMDGTLYDLYKIPEWLMLLENNRWEVFNLPGFERSHIYRIRAAIQALKNAGWTVGVITWAPKGIDWSNDALTEIGHIKYQWLVNNIPELADAYSIFLCIPYGENKARALHKSGQRGDVNYLVDDNKEVRRAWRNWDSDSEFRTINASRAFYRELEGLVM